MTNEELIRALEALLEGLRTPTTKLDEPAPWPTAPLIVADIPNGERRILYRSWDGFGNYLTLDDDLYTQGDTLTDVVPVRVVPVAEWKALVLARAHHDAGGVHLDHLLRRVDSLIAATEALGVTE